ncbi:MAG: alcohol dehydrogenase catalytic domain-containing protein [Sandaracinaceae bacterium]
MRALVHHHGVSVREVPDPEPKDGEARVRVLAAGICNTDLEIARGYMGFEGVLGHELVGEVEDGPLAGQRVVSEINLACGRCATCERGLSRHCPHRTVLGILGKDGCFAERVTLPHVNLHVVPDTVDPEALVFVEPLAAAYEILEQAHAAPGTRALVLGDGKLGLLATFVLAHAGLDVLVAGRHAEKLAIAESYGAKVAPSDLPPRSFDLVIEATGDPSGLAQALELVRPRGTVVLKSTFFGGTELDTATIVIHEITVLGSRCGPFAPAIAAIASRRLDPRPLVSARFALEDGVEAMNAAAERGAKKVILRP